MFIGSNTTILPNTVIESNTIIAAGSLVNHSILGNGVYGGQPAKYICSLDDFINKREHICKIEIKHCSEGLTEETVAECWKRIRKNKKE